MLIWTLLLVLMIMAYALMVVWVLPKLILKSNYPITKTSDRGLKKYKFGDDDYAIVYEPSLDARKYITQYILTKRDGKKTIKCKIAQNVTYIDFDIALFDAEEKCFLVINSMDIVAPDGLVDEIELPMETSYASIIINQVNNKQIREAQKAQVDTPRLVTFGIAAWVLSMGLSFGTLFAFSNIFGGLFRETFAIEMIVRGWIFVLPTLVCAASVGGACYMLYLRNNTKR